MKNRRAWVALLFAMGFALVPYIAAAAGLVPCHGIDCQVCDLVKLAQEVINFLLALSVPIAIGLVAYGGALYFTSAERPANKTLAKEIFRKAFFGFLLALGAFLIVNTLLHSILAPNFYISWNRVQCSENAARDTDATLGELFGQISSFIGFSSPAPIIVSPNQSTNGSYTVGSDPNNNPNNPNAPGWFPGNGTTGSVNGGVTGSGSFGRAGRMCSNSNAACSPLVLAGYGLSANEAAAMSCIAVTESGGNPYIGKNFENSSACGTFQILAGNWSQRSFHGGQCSSATSCNDPVCNTQTAMIMFQQDGYAPWTGRCSNPNGCGKTAYGAPWNPNAVKCVQMYDPNTRRKTLY